MSQHKGTAAVRVPIRQEPIELSQFLKIAQVVMSGGEAKELIQSGAVKVNSIQETHRSRKLKEGDIVDVAGQVVLQVTVGER